MSIGAGITNTKDPLCESCWNIMGYGHSCSCMLPEITVLKKGTISSPGISKKIITVGSVDDINVSENDIGKSYSGRGSY